MGWDRGGGGVVVGWGGIGWGWGSDRGVVWVG